MSDLRYLWHYLWHYTYGNTYGNTYGTCTLSTVVLDMRLNEK